MEGFINQVKKRRVYSSSLLRTLLFACALLTSAVSQAQILLLLSSDVAYYQETAENLKKASSAQGIPSSYFDTFTIQETPQTNALNRPYEFIVAIGTAATREALATKPNTPLLNIFTPKNAFEALAPASDNQQISAVYLDQPLARLITLSCLLKPEAKEFGTIFGPVSKNVQPEIEALVRKNNIHLNHAQLDKDNNPVAVLKPVVQQSDLFIALPDHAIFNRAIAKWILYLGFQQKVPVIGFSKAYTTAGALASVYSSPENIGTHAGELIADWLNHENPAIWQPQYPRYYTLTTNPAVARSLGILLPTESVLYQTFQAMEEKQQ